MNLPVVAGNLPFNPIRGIRKKLSHLSRLLIFFYRGPLLPELAKREEHLPELIKPEYTRWALCHYTFIHFFLRIWTATESSACQPPECCWNSEFSHPHCWIWSGWICTHCSASGCARAAFLTSRRCLHQVHQAINLEFHIHHKEVSASSFCFFLNQDYASLPD